MSGTSTSLTLQPSLVPYDKFVYRKSTFFNVLTKSAVRAENFPFCTIDPEESRVAVPDARFDWLCETYKPASRVPAYLSVIDIAGLVKGASTGQGLGNAFLSHVQRRTAHFALLDQSSRWHLPHGQGIQRGRSCACRGRRRSDP